MRKVKRRYVVWYWSGDLCYRTGKIFTGTNANHEAQAFAKTLKHWELINIVFEFKSTDTDDDDPFAKANNSNPSLMSNAEGGYSEPPLNECYA